MWCESLPFMDTLQALTFAFHTFSFQESLMRILYINNDGGGFADYVEVEPDTTITQFFNRRLPDREAADFLIRVNRQPVPADQVLQVGDRLTITPVKIEGALVGRTIGTMVQAVPCQRRPCVRQVGQT
jgi:hypothetical protein